MDTFLTEMINDPKNTFEVDGKPALEDKSSTNEDTKHITGQKYNIVQTILSDPNKILTEIIDRMHRRHVSLYDGIEIPTVR